MAQEEVMEEVVTEYAEAEIVNYVLDLLYETLKMKDAPYTPPQDLDSILPMLKESYRQAFEKRERLLSLLAEYMAEDWKGVLDSRELGAESKRDLIAGFIPQLLKGELSGKESQ